MNILWNCEVPMSQNDIAVAHPELNKNTIQAVLKKLLENGFIRIETIGYSGTVLTRQYVSNIDQAEYLSESLSKKSAFLLAERFIRTAEGEDLAKLEAALADRKKEL